MESRLIGFDARRSPPDWDAARREVFLLRLDAPQPLSTDVWVWPSIFDYGCGMEGLAIPQWIGPNGLLWENLGTLRTYAGAAPSTMLAVTWHSDGGFRSGNVGPYAEPTAPGAIDPAWRLLGYDVSDGSLVSGLTNCGYRDEEKPVMRPRWASHLNEHHLFDDLARAAEFARLCDGRIKEHAPFFVYGLRVIP